MIVKYSPSFLKIFKKVDVRIRKSFKQKVLIFSKNPHDPQLNNHSLKKEWQGYNSINITADYRAVYNATRYKKRRDVIASDYKEKIIGEDLVAHFVALDTHDKLYNKVAD